ncbi:hypothetical protein HII36_35010 [Nonomuraea sp. NN258]|uniref:hypothetical protein n=1 Tax=Nonomuraea antri TaxID=2730852 RepID=UPI0015685E7A|nr:hypothetical protein [Nonomuraea antri]NRQ37011.1 hypothetical protein [Nonomuraea antri]
MSIVGRKAALTAVPAPHERRASTRTARISLVLAVAASGLALTSPQAVAAPAMMTSARLAPATHDAVAADADATARAGSTAMSCRQVRVYRPEMRKGHVAATGWAIGCSRNQRIKIMLQRKRWWGWQNISSATWYGAGKKTLYKGCKRGTVFTYRLQGQVAYYVGSKYVVHNGWSPTMRAKCP